MSSSSLSVYYLRSSRRKSFTCSIPRLGTIRPAVATLSMPSFVHPPAQAFGATPRPFGHGASKCRLSLRRQLSMAISPAPAEQVAELLKRDLPLQYSDPQKLDFSVYERDVRFTDPMTSIEGKLSYRGMIFTIAIMARTLFRPSTVSFELPECKIVNDDKTEAADDPNNSSNAYILTRFITKGETRWSSPGSAPVVISGWDKFHLSSSLDKIRWHESAWDQTPQEVKERFFRKGG